MAKIKNLKGGGGGGEVEVINFSFTYSLLKGKHCWESKIIEYVIILFHKCGRADRSNL